MKRQGWFVACRVASILSCAVFLLTLAAGCGSGGNGANPPVSATGATWTVTPAGGTFQTTDGRATLIVPQNAVAANVTVTPQLPSSLGAPPVSYAVTNGTLVQFNPVTFNAPVTLQFRIPASVADADVPFVRIFRKPDGSNTWQALPTTVDVSNRIATAQTSQFSGFGVFTANIGPNEWAIDQPGGNFTGSNNRIGLTVAQNAVNSLYRVRYTPIARTDMDDLPPGWRYVEDSGFDFVWSDPTTQFNPAATFKVRFSGLNIPCDQSLVAIFTRTDFGSQHQWTQGATGVDTQAGEATLSLNRLQQHALFCPEPVLPAYIVTRDSSSNASNQQVTSIQVSRLDGTAFVPVASQSYEGERYSSTLHFQEGIINSGSQVSADTSIAAASAHSTGTTGTIQLVALHIASNTIETIDSLPTNQSLNFAFIPGISPDGGAIASKIQEVVSGQVTRSALRVYSRQSHTLLSETDLPTTDRSDVEAVANNGVVVLSNRRTGGSNVTVVRNGSVQMQISGVMPRLNREATKMYVLNGGQIEEYDLTNGQPGAPIPISPVDYAIKTGKVVQFRQAGTSCQLVSTDILTRQETVVAPSVPCPTTSAPLTADSETFMLR